MTDSSRSGAGRVRRELVAFVAVGLLALTTIAIGAVSVIDWVAREQALKEDERVTTRLATHLFAPLLDDVLSGAPGARLQLDGLVDSRLGDGLLNRVVVWDASGTVVYSDDDDTMGRRFPVPAAALAAIERGEITSGIEQTPETGAGAEPELVEVYVPLALSDRILAFEAYYSYHTVEMQAAALTTLLVPLAVGSLVLLQVVQIPIATSLARRVRRHEMERSHLLEQALSASERERKEIAASLHDGVIQDLAGVGYVLGALSRGAASEQQEITDRLGTTVRGAVDSLRRLMVDIYPPDLRGSGLAAAVTNLTTVLRSSGTAVELQIEPLPALSSEVAATLYRTARETLNNVGKHARARAVRVRLEPDHDPRWQGRPAVRLRVSDDGVGLPPGGIDRRAEGHLGLQLLVDRVAELGGELTVTSRNGAGTTADARVPAGADGPQA